MQTVRMDRLNERLALLKALLGLSGTEKDTPLELALRTVEDRVLGYIHWDTLPEGLERPLVLMTAAYWKGAALGGEETAGGLGETGGRVHLLRRERRGVRHGGDL